VTLKNLQNARLDSRLIAALLNTLYASLGEREVRKALIHQRNILHATKDSVLHRRFSSLTKATRAEALASMSDVCYGNSIL